MLFIPKGYLNPLPIILLNGTILEWVDSLLYFGFNLDIKVLTCLLKFVGMFYANFVSVQNMMKMYNSLVLPNIQQNIIWSCYPKKRKIK